MLWYSDKIKLKYHHILTWNGWSVHRSFPPSRCAHATSHYLHVVRSVIGTRTNGLNPSRKNGRNHRQNGSMSPFLFVDKYCTLTRRHMPAWLPSSPGSESCPSVFSCLCIYYSRRSTCASSHCYISKSYYSRAAYYTRRSDRPNPH